MRRTLWALPAAALFATLPLSAQQPAAAPALPTPTVGTVAPDFTLMATTSTGPLAQPVKLSDFRGKVVVLAFFPAARTRGCTIQMRAYRDQYAELFNGGKDVVVLAISTDPIATLTSWAQEETFPFLMASDTPMDVATKYGAVRSDTRTNRNLFVVDAEGKVAFSALPFREIDPTAYEELDGVVTKLLGNR